MKFLTNKVLGVFETRGSMSFFFLALLTAMHTRSVAFYQGSRLVQLRLGRNITMASIAVSSSTTSKYCQANSRIPDFRESGSFSFLVLPAHTTFSLPILHAKKITANLKKSESYQWKSKRCNRRNTSRNIVASWTDSAGHRASAWIIFFPVIEAVLKKTNAQDVFERTD